MSLSVAASTCNKSATATTPTVSSANGSAQLADGKRLASEARDRALIVLANVRERSRSRERLSPHNSSEAYAANTTVPCQVAQVADAHAKDEIAERLSPRNLSEARAANTAAPYEVAAVAYARTNDRIAWGEARIGKAREDAVLLQQINPESTRHAGQDFWTSDNNLLSAATNAVEKEEEEV
eukprot:CAMPEP_0173090376 /NCGR_PEP_ID=MMETSP1102-20130122/26863_1 /TAXON_ID=49646 /ORGANISM="Geminigera sp., Strain Caron Lab Isolate" /LENGTH=181 /DNA_ID=CAMNT_0013975199 /DNA_START=208 /DNA_END=750 /DNA_ORIENTATION=+